MIRVAIIGTGNISPAHFKGYLTFKGRCEIVALVDIVPEKAREKAKAFGLENVAIYDNHEAILDRKDIDLVSICTPPYVHASIGEACLRSGKHVLVEKPMAASLDACDALIKARDESGKCLSVVAQNRFRPSIKGIYEILKADLIGPVLSAEIDSLWWRGRCYYDLWWRGTWEKEGGGCTLNHAVHHIDMLNWMMGMPETVYAILANVAHDNSEVEDLSMALLKYPSGAVGRVTSSLVHHGEQQTLAFQGLDAAVKAPFEVQAHLTKDNGFPYENEGLKERIVNFYEGLDPMKYEAHTGQIDDVLRAIENNTKPLVTAEQGRDTLELISAIYQSGFTNQTVQLPMTQADPFYTYEGILKNSQKFYEKTGHVQDFKSKNITTGSAY